MNSYRRLRVFRFLFLKVGSSVYLKVVPTERKKNGVFYCKKRGVGFGLQTPVANARVKGKKEKREKKNTSQR